MKKTKIVCSIGPSSSYPEVFNKMVKLGMNVARINFSHATIEECEHVVRLVNGANDEPDTHIAIMYDTKGPDFRTGMVENGSIFLKDGELIDIVEENVLGTTERITVNYKKAIESINNGALILIDDGLMKLEVIDAHDHVLTCRVLIGGLLGDRKSINVPGVELGMPFLSELDISDIKYACSHGGDFVALSFVSCKEDVLAVRDLIVNENSHMKIISKIESASAIDNIDEIIDASDGIMVARGDLGVELSLIDLPIIQKKLIKKCREKGKFCIVATEMLSSMTKKSRPTRAEISDVANAVLDGTDAVMLSNETTIGDHPVETVKVMAEACEHVEKHLDYGGSVIPLDQKNIMKTIANSVVIGANNLDVSGILASTRSGLTAIQISTLRPKPMILAACTTVNVARSLAFNFGIVPCVIPECHATDEIIEVTKKKSKELLGLKQGDLVVIAGGFPQTKKTNFMKIEEI